MSVTPHASQTFVDAGTGIINPTREQAGTARPHHSRMNDRVRVDASVEHSHMVISWQTEDAPSDLILINEDHKYIDVPCRGSGNVDAEKDKAASSI